MSDFKKNIHIQIDGHDVTAEIDNAGDVMNDELIHILRGLVCAIEKKEKGNLNLKNEKEENKCPSSDDEKSGITEDENGDFISDNDCKNDISAEDMLRAIKLLSELIDKDNDSKDDAEDKLLTHDQKNVLVGFDVACDSILMFLANLDLYRDQIQKALLAYGYDARDSRTANAMIEKMFTPDALSALAVSDSDHDQKEYGAAFCVYKALRDAMMEFLKNNRTHIVASFIEDTDACTSKEE